MGNPLRPCTASVLPGASSFLTAPRVLPLNSPSRRQAKRSQLEEIVKQRIGAGDFKVTVHANPETGWHATIYGRRPAEVHRCQVMADTIVIELCQHYDLDG